MHGDNLLVVKPSEGLVFLAQANVDAGDIVRVNELSLGSLLQLPEEFSSLGGARSVSFASRNPAPSRSHLGES